MFKLPNNIPLLRDSAQDWADYAEYSAIKCGRISLLDLIKGPQLISDEIDVAGIEDDTDRYTNKADDISTEINYRIRILNGKYPFLLLDRDYSLEFQNDDNTSFLIYKYLLFATRVNMKTDKIQDGIDGTQIFEKLSAEIIISFLGTNAKVDILGTSKTNLGGFRAKLQDIVSRLKEGGAIHANPGYRPQDDTVDVIAWKGFTDGQSSQLIAFGQCKTGTSWQGNLSELNPQAFCNRWFTRQPVVKPIRMFFCAQYFPRDIWYERATSAGLIFDRFRIIDYLPVQLEREFRQEIANWTNAACIIPDA